MYEFYVITATVCVFLLAMWLLPVDEKRESCDQCGLHQDIRKIQTLAAALLDTDASLSKATRSMGVAAQKLRDESVRMMGVYEYLPDGEQRTNLFSALEYVERSCEDLIVKAGNLESPNAEGGG